MKKTSLFGAVALSTLALCALNVAGTTAQAQESRQDVSISGFTTLIPTVHGNAGTVQYGTKTVGGVISYRYLLTPKSALEVNYGYTQNYTYFNANNLTTSQTFSKVHTRQQEYSAAYVFGLTFKRYNPFVQAGAAAMIFSPIFDAGTFTRDLKRNTAIGGLFGGGVAYELSPSFDIRVEYRGVYVKAPSFGNTGLGSGKYEVLSMPAVGVAYHF